MNISRSLPIAVAVLVVCTPFVRSEESAPPEGPRVATNEWRTEYAKALEIAAQQGRNVLLDFTGSDWCIWCHRLDAEVFAQPTFIDYAARSLVLVEVDFPRQKSLGPDLLKENMELAVRYGISEYPTIVLLDATGKELGRTGYMEGGAKTFVRTLKHLAAQPLPVKS